MFVKDENLFEIYLWEQNHRPTFYTKLIWLPQTGTSNTYGDFFKCSRKGCDVVYFIPLIPKAMQMYCTDKTEKKGEDVKEYWKDFIFWLWGNHIDNNCVWACVLPLS